VAEVKKEEVKKEEVKKEEVKEEVKEEAKKEETKKEETKKDEGAKDAKDITMEDDDEMPDLVPAPGGTGGDAAEAEGEAGGKQGKQSRSEKKNRKAVAKLGMKQVPGVLRVTVKKGKSILFVVANPDVFKSPSSDSTWVVFGEAKIEDATDEALKATAQQFAAGDDDDGPPDLVEASGDKLPAEPAPTTAAPASAPATAAPGGGADDISESHIQLVLDQAKQATREQAIEALRKNNKDVVNAIMALTVGQ